MNTEAAGIERGGVETNASMPRFPAHAALSADERRAAGIADGFVRLALGNAHAAHLGADLQQALAPERSTSAGERA